MTSFLGPKHPKAFRNNYLAAMGVLVFLLFTLVASAQIIPPPSTTYANRFNRGVFDSTLYGPTGCGVPADSTWLFSKGFGNGGKAKQFAQYYDSCGHHLYAWDPSLRTWHRVDSSGGGGSSYDSATSQGGVFHTGLYNDTRFLKRADSAGPTGFVPRNQMDTAKANLRSLIGSGGYDSATSQGGVFHTLLFNDSRYVRKSDSAGAGYQTYARGTKIADSLMTLLNSLLTLKVNKSDSAGTGYLTYQRATKLMDSLNLVIATKRNTADTVSFAGTTTNGHLQKIIDSLLALTDTSIFRATGATGVSPFTLFSSGKTNALNLPKYRDTSARQTAYTPDSALAIADHDTTSVNALQTKAQTDSMRANIYAALGLYKLNADSISPTGYASHARLGKVVDSLVLLLNKKINITDSAGAGYATFNRLKKVADSLGALITGGGGTPGLQAVLTANPNLTGDNTIGLATHKLTISGGPVWADSVKIAGLDSVVKAWLAILNIFGDSFNNPGPGTTSQDSIASIRFADSLKIPYNNFATSGTGVMVAITRADSLVNGPFNNCMTWWQIGYNDLRASGADARTPLKVVAADCAGMVNNFASKYVSASDTTSSILKRWGAFNTGILAGISCPVKMKAAASTTTINDSITYKGNGRYFGVVLIAGDSLTFVHSIVNIFVDNVFYKTVNTNGVADGTAVVAGHTDSRIPYGVVSDASTSGIHTIKLANPQARIMMVDYFAVLSTNRPTFMLFHTIYPVASPTVYINLNNAIDSMRATWPAAFNILDIPVNDKFDRTTGLWTDATHPNDRGQGQIDRSALDQWNALANYTNQQVTADAAGLFYTDKGKERVMNSKEVWTRSDPAVNLPGYLSVGLGMSYKINGVDVFKPDVAFKNYSIGNGAGVTMTTPTATGNNWFGDVAGTTCTTCANNSGYGTGVMQLTTTATANAGFGNFALQQNTTGGSNTGFGHSALKATSTGSNNTCGGQGCLVINSSGNANTGLGVGVLQSETTGTGNSVIGYQGGQSFGAVNYNSGIGYQIFSSSTGAQNSGVGAFSQAFQLAGTGNSSLGYQSLYGNATNTSWNYSIGVGYKAGFTNKGDTNIYIGLNTGINAAIASITGHGNTIMGGDGDTLPSVSTNGFLNIRHTIFADIYSGRVSIGNISIGNSYLNTHASTTSYSSLNIPSGTAPTSPNHGDVWTDASHIYARLSGTTYQLDQQTGSSFYQTVQINTSSQTQRAKLNFGTQFVGADNSGNGSTDISLTNDASSFGGAYLPTVAGIVNTGSVLIDSFFYQRSGRIVHVTGYVTVVVSANNTETELTFTLPLASTLGANDLIGTLAIQNPDGTYSAGILSRYASDHTKGLIAGKCGGGTTSTEITYFRFECTYKIN